MSSNDNEKDFIDKFFDYFNIYKESGVRFFAVAFCFFILSVIGLLAAPLFLKMCIAQMPFKVEFLLLSPLDVLFNYCKIALFFSSAMTFPYFLYQFGKLRYEKLNEEEKIDRIINSLIVTIIIFAGMFLTYKYIFPFEIMFLYGMNFAVASTTSSFSAIVASFIYTDFLVTLLILMPFMRYLIKNSKFFNYSEMVKYKKPIMIYSGILTAIIALPIEFLAFGAVFATFFLWYKILLNFSKTRE